MAKPKIQPEDKKDPFRFLTSILETKEYQEDLDDYAPYFISHGLSQHLDCILFVNEVNKTGWQLTNQQQYDYYFHSIRKMKRRFGKWSKKSDDKLLKLVSEYFQVSNKKAEEIITLLTKENIEYIEKQTEDVL